MNNHHHLQSTRRTLPPVIEGLFRLGGFLLALLWLTWVCLQYLAVIWILPLWQLIPCVIVGIIVVTPTVFVLCCWFSRLRSAK